MRASEGEDICCGSLSQEDPKIWQGDRSVTEELYPKRVIAGADRSSTYKK